MTGPRSWLQHWQATAVQTPWRDALTRALAEAQPGEPDTTVGADLTLARAVAYWLLACEAGPETDVDTLDAVEADALLTPESWPDLAARLRAAGVDADGDGDVDDAWARLSRHSPLRPGTRTDLPG
ncbi:hypothetical protein AB0I28_34885 [Phytomonospora sp. NPDC050363]|uniref:hypothetical protein n=1 Tax=Phytomonospora sp. NPDC050363 TaxID=3155642 RepID=UPI0033C3986E